MSGNQRRFNPNAQSFVPNANAPSFVPGGQPAFPVNPQQGFGVPPPQFYQQGQYQQQFGGNFPPQQQFYSQAPQQQQFYNAQQPPPQFQGSTNPPQAQQPVLDCKLILF
jgi:hypothetical protein